MINYIIKLTLSLTQSHMPAVLTSLPFQPPRTGKSTPPQSVLPSSPSIDNGAYGIENLLLKTQLKILHSEIKLIVYYIVLQGQYGLNIKTT